jgi:hypothetical protein
MTTSVPATLPTAPLPALFAPDEAAARRFVELFAAYT